MVDVTAKAETAREARARVTLRMRPATLAAIRSGAVKKGDVLGVARLAGIMAAKRTADLIPLCHPLRLTGIDVAFVVDRGALGDPRRDRGADGGQDRGRDGGADGRGGGGPGDLRHGEGDRPRARPDRPVPPREVGRPERPLGAGKGRR